MRLVLNLAIPPSARQRYALHWSIPATGLGLIGLIFLLWFSVSSYRECKRVEKAVAECQTRLNGLTGQEASLHRRLEEPQSRQLLKNTHFVNGLINDRRFSLAELVADITRLMPPDVCLTGLSTSPEGEQAGVRFLVTAKTEGAIEAFLNNLEDSPRFQDVAIVNQGFEQRGSNPELENITCTARYVMLKHESSGE